MFIKSNGISKKSIAEYLDVSAAFITQLAQGKRSIPDDKIAKIKANKAWNTTMLKNEIIPVKASRIDSSCEGIPLIPISAMAGFGEGDMQVLECECERFVVPTFRDAEFLIQVKGSSMYPKYSSGDIVACKKLPVDTFFQWNKVYVLDTVQGALIKRVKKSEKNDRLLIVSDNPKYDPFELKRSEIHSVAIVIGVIRLE